MANNRLSPRAFIILFGVLSMLGDFVYEGARSIAGPFLAGLGASAFTVGLISGGAVLSACDEGNGVRGFHCDLRGSVADWQRCYRCVIWGEYWCCSHSHPSYAGGCICRICAGVAESSLNAGSLDQNS